MPYISLKNHGHGHKWRTIPTHLDGVTVVTCTHPYHGVEQFWLPIDDYQQCIVSLTGTYWANGYTIIIQPAL